MGVGVRRWVELWVEKFGSFEVKDLKVFEFMGEMVFGVFWWILVGFGGSWWILVDFGGFWWILVDVESLVVGGFGRIWLEN